MEGDQVAGHIAEDGEAIEATLTRLESKRMQADDAPERMERNRATDQTEPEAPPVVPGLLQPAVAPGAPLGPVTAAGYSAPPCSGMAIVSLVLGIFSILTVLVVWVVAPVAILPAVPAVVFGYLAQGKIGRSGGKLGGIALAKAGMILGYVGIGFG
ncbi:MAG TPA: DUF4190 domain-containing protein, partial [Verrucomicrobiales bacterium]|nr:DUF4190 domain-containing protein [Verrucomicrobiales bacterium]